MFGSMPLISHLPLHPDGKSLRKWVKHQNMDDVEQSFQWDEKYLAIGELSTSYFENLTENVPKTLSFKGLVHGLSPY